MDLAMRQGYGACALPLCGGGRLLRRRSETDRFSLFFSIFVFFIVRLLLPAWTLEIQGKFQITPPSEGRGNLGEI